jgi:hypothetical protein
LTTSAWRQRVQNTHAKWKRAIDHCAPQWVGRSVVASDGVKIIDRWTAIDWLTKAVKYAAEQVVANANHVRLAGRRCWGTGTHTMKLTKWHANSCVIAQRDNFGQ